mmetsp:Transcript_7365/g.16121  ORF Transcript_7365/g.16121 Transcript_7365/m.16121 type:complete len:224 (+) Transcript_7365:2433-3104(+)
MDGTLKTARSGIPPARDVEPVLAALVAWSSGLDCLSSAPPLLGMDGLMPMAPGMPQSDGRFLAAGAAAEECAEGDAAAAAPLRVALLRADPGAAVTERGDCTCAGALRRGTRDTGLPNVVTPKLVLPFVAELEAGPTTFGACCSCGLGRRLTSSISASERLSRAGGAGEAGGELYPVHPVGLCGRTAVRAWTKEGPRRAWAAISPPGGALKEGLLRHCAIPVG